MLPGKQYRPEDLLRIGRQRIWLILVPFAVVSAMTAVVARWLPDTYKSQAQIQVVPQRIPENYVKSTVTTRIEDRLQSIREQILSRTRLEQVIKEFNLYAEERRTGIMENIVARMRSDVKVDVNRGEDSFTISYVGSDAQVVTKVTAKLATMFIDESLRDREVLAEGTDQFLEERLEEARSRLIEQEKKLEAYRNRNAGQLPTQEAANLQALANTQMQIQQLAQEGNRDSDRRLSVERSLRELQNEPDSESVPDAGRVASQGTPEAPQNGSSLQLLDAAKATLAQMKLVHSDEHPDVKKQKNYVDTLQRKVDAEALERPVSAPEPSSSLADQGRQKRMRGYQDELDQLDRQVAIRQADIARLRGNANILQQRIDAVPAKQSEMTELTRDYGTLNTMYLSLLAKKEDSKLSASLERRQIGEQFKLIDPARVPERPASPNRPLINLIGMTAGFVIGIGLIVLLEYRDTSFTTDEEVVSLLGLPVLAVVPVMLSQADIVRVGRRKLILSLGLGGTVAACLMIVAYTFVR